MSTIYTSMQEMENFFKDELNYVEDLRAIYDKKLIGQEGKRSIATYIQSFEDILGDQEEDVSFMHNPLNAYNLIRHVAVGWAVVEAAIEEDRGRRGGNIGKRMSHVLARRDNRHVPKEEDVDGVARGIVRLHDFYRFNLTDFVNEGVINLDGIRHETTGDLTVWDAFKIGVKGTNGLIFGSGIQVLEAALVKASSEGFSAPTFINPLDLKVLKNLVATAKTVHDQKLDTLGDRSDAHSTNPFPFSKTMARKKKFKKNQDLLRKSVTLGRSGIHPRQEMYQYMEMCRGKELRPQNVTSRLMCMYSRGHHPTYIIGPLKVEVVSLEPYIIIIHNFILDREIRKVVSHAVPKLRRSVMAGQGEKQISGIQDDRRVSETAWLEEDDSPALAQLTNRIDTFLNLNGTSTSSSELYQVVNYGLGGQYIYHYDPVMMDRKSIQNRDLFNMFAGDRMVTFMGYLSDVEAGGYTVFPLVGAVVRPRRGSVVLWWNMDSAGGYDLRVKHGGCPVMVGSKWITNKWIRAKAQTFRRPCPKFTREEIRGFRNNPRQELQRGGFFTDF